MSGKIWPFEEGCLWRFEIGLNTLTLRTSGPCGRVSADCDRESPDGEGGRVIVLELSCLEGAHAKAGLGWTRAARFLSRSQKKIPREAAGVQQHGRWLPGWPDSQHSRMRVWVTPCLRHTPDPHPCWKFSFRYYLGTGWEWGVISSHPPAAGHILNKWALCKSGVFKF